VVQPSDLCLEADPGLALLLGDLQLTLLILTNVFKPVVRAEVGEDAIFRLVDGALKPFDAGQERRIVLFRLRKTHDSALSLLRMGKLVYLRQCWRSRLKLLLQVAQLFFDAFETEVASALS
jgi:hypothetical protein